MGVDRGGGGVGVGSMIWQKWARTASLDIIFLGKTIAS